MATIATGRRHKLRTLGIVAGSVALALIGTRAWLLRDPEPHFRERHSGLASVQVSDVRLDRAMREEDVVVHDSSGLRVEMRVRRRADTAASTPSPLLVLLGGHMSGKESASLIADPREFVVASLSYPFDGNERVTGVAVVGEVPGIRRAIWDTPPAVMLALDYLLTRPDVDPARVELVGASFGVPFAAVVGALDPRVKRVWLVQGGGDPYTLILAGLQSEIGFMPARKFGAALASTLASGPRFAPERWVSRIAPRPVMMVNTLDDERIPRSTAEALYAAAREPKTIVWLPGLHVQPNRPDVLGALVDAVLSGAR
ncbi:MAG: hypothetical protein O2973_04500 [Gemmatimonadetes bacterium]|nr:hypothetical protein [Gemmatimonadota bacterium]